MRTAQATKTPQVAQAKAKLTLLPQAGKPVKLTPALVAQANRGTELQRIISEAKKELDNLKNDFDALMLANKT